MGLDPAARSVLDQIESAGVLPLHLLTPEEARSRVDPIADAGIPLAEVGRVEDCEIAGVPVRVYRPEGNRPFPILQWMHGGGWVTGSTEGADATARQLCSRSGWAVVSLDYRLAPEHKFPAALDDVLAVADGLAERAEDLGGDPGILAVGGTSAGGNLAAVAAQQRPDLFRLQVLVYPITDLTLSQPSVTENAEGYGLTKAAMEWYREHYVGGADVDLLDPLVSPLHAPDRVISQCPPALVFTAGYDVLRDEGLAYGDRLEANEVPVQRAHYPGQIHRFYGMHQLIQAADDALDVTADALKRANPSQLPSDRPTKTKTTRPTGLRKWFFRSPSYLYRARLGFLLGRRFLMIEHRGRKSGNLYRTVLEVAGTATEADEWIVAAGFGPGSDWYRNLQAGNLQALWLGSYRHEKVRVRFLGHEEAGRVMGEYERAHPRTAQGIYKAIGVSYDGTDAGRVEMMKSIPMVGLTVSDRPNM